MPKMLRAAKDKAAKAKADAAAKWQALEQARAALAAADVPQDGAITSMAEFVAAEAAKGEYEAAAKAAEAAEAEVERVANAMGDDDAAPAFARGGAPSVHTKEWGPDEAQGFKSLGEFVHAVAFDPAKLAQHGVEFHAEQTTSGAIADGGFPIPPQFAQEILEVPTTRQIVRPRATVIPAGGQPDAELNILPLNQVGAGMMHAGVEVYWEDEEAAADASATTLKVGDYVKLKAKSVRAIIEETNKVIRNHAWSSPLLSRKLSEALVNSEDLEFISGTLATRPVGVRSCTGTIYVNRKLALKVVWEDVLGMVAKLHPDSREKAVFLANQSLYPQLRDLKDAAGERVYMMGDPTKGQPDMLDGIPVLYTGKVGAVGAKGDLMLVDFTYYLIKDGQQMLISTSEHALFKRDRTVIKINRSVDGKGWLTGPLTLEDGATTVSPFVGLDVPAI